MANDEPTTTGPTVAIGEAAIEFVTQSGISPHDIDRAASDGTLPFLVIETLFAGEAPTLTVAQLADRSGVGLRTAVEIRRAMGFVDADADELVATDADVDAIRALLLGYRDQSELVVLDRVRSAAGALTQLADSFASSFGDGLGDQLDAGVDPLVIADEALAENAPARIIDSLEYLLRVQLAAASRRERLNRSATSTSGSALTQAVGFIDLVGMTAIMERIRPDEVGELVRIYENVAARQIAQSGGRVVKMLGDGVVYVAPTADIAIEITQQLLPQAGHQRIPPARAGVAWGAITRANGDIYGPTVNRASRLCDRAEPGHVLFDAGVAECLTTHPTEPGDIIWLKGIGHTPTHRLRSASTGRVID